MANTITPQNSSCFDIDGIPQGRGVTLPNFDSEKEAVEFFPAYDINRKLINFTRYDQLINGLTGLAFASFAELKQFCRDYIYRGDGSNSGAGTRTRAYLIRTVPAAANEKAPGQYITDADLSGLDPNKLVMYIVDDLGVTVYAGTGLIAYTSDIGGGIGQIGLVGGDVNTFVNGQTVIIFGEA